MTPHPTIATLGELRTSDYRSRSVRAEMRANLIDHLRRGEALLPGIIGYDETVLPQLENAILAGQDVILLGERGQAKSRIARSLVALLDEWLPVVAGSELRDDPLEPISPYGRQLVAERGDDTPVDVGASVRSVCGEAVDAGHHASPTSSVRSIRSRSRRVATCPTS